MVRAQRHVHSRVVGVRVDGVRPVSLQRGREPGHMEFAYQVSNVLEVIICCFLPNIFDLKTDNSWIHVYIFVSYHTLCLFTIIVIHIWLSQDWNLFALCILWCFTVKQYHIHYNVCWWPGARLRSIHSITMAYISTLLAALTCIQFGCIIDMCLKNNLK